MIVLLKIVRFSTVIVMLLALGPRISAAQDPGAEKVPARYGMSAIWGKTFDPVTDIHFFQLSGFVMWDYEDIWRHWAPDPLRFKLEAAAGAAAVPETRAMLSVEMTALYYLDFLSGRALAPYLEGGLGVIYTDFQVKDPKPPGDRQGLRFGFNPFLGVGLEFQKDAGPPYFAALRLSHISNGDLHTENRGVNSIVFMAGRFF